LEDEVEVQPHNAAPLHNLPDRKTGVTDPAWIARLVEHDLAGRASCRRPNPAATRSDRYRAALTRERTREKQRISREKQRINKLLEVARISCRCSFGPFRVSARAALSVGQFGPQALSTDKLLT
jgi:hypothetical protein